MYENVKFKFDRMYSVLMQVTALSLSNLKFNVGFFIYEQNTLSG